MKKITLILLTLTFSLGAFSQVGDLGTKNPEECKKNLSLYTDYMKQKMYKDAFKFWNKVVEYCPKYNANLYDNGSYIMRQLLKNKKLSKKRITALKDSVIWTYTENIRLFGENPNVNSNYGYYLVLYKNNYEKGASILKSRTFPQSPLVHTQTFLQHHSSVLGEHC